MKASRHLLLALTFAAAAASAQPHGGGHGRGGSGEFAGAMDMDRLAILLDLDAYQKGEVERVLNEQRAAAIAARDELRSDQPRPSLDEMRARRESFRNDTLTKLQTILTEQQLTKFKALTERPDRPANGRRAPRAAG
jgi:hypothetical protein